MCAQVARFPHPTLPSLRAQMTVPHLRFFISPGRVRRIMRVLRAAMPTGARAAAAAPGFCGPRQQFLLTMQDAPCVHTLRKRSFTACRSQRVSWTTQLHAPERQWACSLEQAGKAEDGPGAGAAASPAAGAWAEQPRWRADAEYSGRLKVLEWGGLSRSSAQWQPRWAALHRGLLYLLPDQDAPAPTATHNIWRNRCANRHSYLLRF